MTKVPAIPPHLYEGTDAESIDPCTMVHIQDILNYTWEKERADFDCHYNPDGSLDTDDVAVIDQIVKDDPTAAIHVYYSLVKVQHAVTQIEERYLS